MHISELSGKHVELAEQVVSVGDEVFVKVIDIDLERRRISLASSRRTRASTRTAPSSTPAWPLCTAWSPSTTSRATTSTPRASTPTTRRVARGLRRPSARRGSRVRGRAGPLGVAQGADPRRRDSEDDLSRRRRRAARQLVLDRESQPRRGTLADDESLAALREKLSQQLLSELSRSKADGWPVPFGGRPFAVRAAGGSGSPASRGARSRRR